APIPPLFPYTTLFRSGGQADTDGVEVGNRISQVKRARTIQGVPPLLATFTLPRAALEESGRWIVVGRQYVYDSAAREQDSRVSFFFTSHFPWPEPWSAN